MLIFITIGFNSVGEYFNSALENVFKHHNIKFITIRGKKELYKISKNDTIFLLSGSWQEREKYKDYKKIIYNTEPLCLKKSEYDLIGMISDCNLVLEFSELNFEELSKNNILFTYLPMGYSNIYENMFTEHVTDKTDKDIDIFFFGTMSKRRKNIVDKLKETNHNVVSGKYFGKERDEFINRSKIVIVINNHDDIKTHTNDLYRLSYLISNKVFVVVEETSDKNIDNEFKNIGMVVCRYDDLIQSCKNSLDLSQNDRDKICDNIYDYFKIYYDMKKMFPHEKIKELINAD